MLDVQSQVSNFMFSVSLGLRKLPMMLGAKLHIFGLPDCLKRETPDGFCIFLSYIWPSFADLPNGWSIQGRLLHSNIISPSHLYPSYFVIMHNKKMMYIGEVLDIYKKFKGNNSKYKSLEFATIASSLAVCVYLLLQLGNVRILCCITIFLTQFAGPQQWWIWQCKQRQICISTIVLMPLARQTWLTHPCFCSSSSLQFREECICGWEQEQSITWHSQCRSLVIIYGVEGLESDDHQSSEQ